MNEYSYLLSFRLSKSKDKENYDKRRDALLNEFNAKSVFDTNKKENETSNNSDNKNEIEPTTSTIIWESNDNVDYVIKIIQDILDFEDIALLICCINNKLEEVVRIMPEKYIKYSSIINLLNDESKDEEVQNYLDCISKLLPEL